MARMMPIDEKEIKKAGYTYNSSLNPTCIPGRYNHLDKPRTWFYKDDVLQLPASVSPVFRFPLFWLAYHNLPAKVYRWLFSENVETRWLHCYLFSPLGIYQSEKMEFTIYHNQSFGRRYDKTIGRFDILLYKKGLYFYDLFFISTKHNTKWE